MTKGHIVMGAAMASPADIPKTRTVWPTQACQWCKTVKPLGSFALSEKTKSGRDGVCTMCRDTVGKACKSKKAYVEFGTAARAALHRSRLAAKPLRPYMCEACKRWHLTSRVSL